MRIVTLLLTLLLPAHALAEAPRDPTVPLGLFECRAKEGKPHRLKLSDLGFVPMRCPSAPAILVTDDGPIDFGMPFAEVAKRLGLPGDAPTTLRKNLGTAGFPESYTFMFDERDRLYRIQRGIADHVAEQLAAYWGPSLPILGQLPTRAWFHPKNRIRATIEDRAMDLAESPREKQKFDGHRYILEYRTYTPVRDLFGPGGPFQCDVIGKTIEEIERDFPELRVTWFNSTEGEVTTRKPGLNFQQTELDSFENSSQNLELVDGRITRARWRFGLGDEQTLGEILAETIRATGGAVVSSEMPNPEQIVVTFKLPTGTLLTLTSRFREYSYGETQQISGKGALWEVSVSRP